MFLHCTGTSTHGEGVIATATKVLLLPVVSGLLASAPDSQGSSLAPNQVFVVVEHAGQLQLKTAS